MSDTNTPDPRRKLVDVIGTSVCHARALRESLDDERQALESQDLDALHAAADNKTRCVEALQTLEAERRRLCAASGIGDPAGGLGHLARTDSRIASGWEQLLAVLSECNRLNRTNGAIIRVRKDQFETSLAVLRGGSMATELYGRDGAGSHAGGQRSLAEA